MKKMICCYIVLSLSLSYVQLMCNSTVEAAPGAPGSMEGSVGGALLSLSMLSKYDEGKNAPLLTVFDKLE